MASPLPDADPLGFVFLVPAIQGRCGHLDDPGGLSGYTRLRIQERPNVVDLGSWSIAVYVFDDSSDAERHQKAVLSRAECLVEVFGDDPVEVVDGVTYLAPQLIDIFEGDDVPCLSVEDCSAMTVLRRTEQPPAQFPRAGIVSTVHRGRMLLVVEPERDGERILERRIFEEAVARFEEIAEANP